MPRTKQQHWSIARNLVPLRLLASILDKSEEASMYDFRLLTEANQTPELHSGLVRQPLITARWELPRLFFHVFLLTQGTTVWSNWCTYIRNEFGLLFNYPSTHSCGQGNISSSSSPLLLFPLQTLIPRMWIIYCRGSWCCNRMYWQRPQSTQQIPLPWNEMRLIILH